MPLRRNGHTLTELLESIGYCPSPITAENSADDLIEEAKRLGDALHTIHEDIGNWTADEDDYIEYYKSKNKKET